VRVTAPVVVQRTIRFPSALRATCSRNSHTSRARLKAGATAGTYRVLSWWAPIELGARYVAPCLCVARSGTEPASTTIRIGHTYFDKDGNALPEDRHGLFP
jgi:hypothetical protein